MKRLVSKKSRMTPHQVQWKLHQARDKLTPSIELRRKMLEAAYHGQLHAEKVNIEGHIGRPQPGVRKTYLELRFVIATRMCELMDDCSKMCKKFLDETRQMYEKEKKQ